MNKIDKLNIEIQACVLEIETHFPELYYLFGRKSF